MAGMKSLLKDTAVYGMSSIVGRFLNYLLVPLYTAKISAESGGYGVVTNLYAYTALVLVILTFGMETTMFRFANKEGEKPDTVFATALLMPETYSRRDAEAVFRSTPTRFTQSSTTFPRESPSFFWFISC